jgi:DNA repair photolyase
VIKMRTFADVARPGRDRANKQLPLALQAARTVTTPEFSGMTFLEVETKSALNKVSGMPFAWSINPYRGCSHACSYCVDGDTAILMADGRTKPMAEVRQGDEIYGTQRGGLSRRLVRTPVLDHWSVTKPAYRVQLEDGTELITSGDHRFLTDRGWRYVAGARHGGPRRPRLATSHRLVGPGHVARPPRKDANYRRGYLTGLIRGASLLPSFTSYPRDGEDHGDVLRSQGLALVDVEALNRTHEYLAAEQVETDRFVFAQAGRPAPDDLREPQALRTQGWDAVARIRNLVTWPGELSDEWSRGFLAGLFDADGGSRGGVRIHSSDGELLDIADRCLQRLGLSSVLERSPVVERRRDPARTRGRHAIRLLGGATDILRFVQSVDPASTRRRLIEGMAVEARAATRVVDVAPLGLEMPLYDITTGTGDFIANGVVSHNCFARPSHRYLELSPAEDFERMIVVKTNVVDVLRAELARPSWRGEKVALGTNTDPYQRCEGRYRLLPGIIRALTEARTPLSILTKGTLVTRDTELLAEAARRGPTTAALTIGMLDDDCWRASEPGTPHPSARLRAVRALNDAGVPTGIMLAPIMPGINDDREQLAAVIDAAAAAGATHITPIVLHLRPGVREVFMPWLEHTYPHLVARYRTLYRGSQPPKEYRAGVHQFVEERRRRAQRRYGRSEQAELPQQDVSQAQPPGEAVSRAHAGEQLRLV